MSSEEIPSPCIGVCALDYRDICQGCYRSGDEITEWFMADTERKEEILREAEQRMSEAQTIRLS